MTTLLAAQGGIEDGAWLVELASLSDPDPVPQAVASVLGVRGLPGDTLLDSLCLHLGSREVLLILDNREHLVNACASLAEALLRSCPRLRILATSRETLGVSGETLYQCQDRPGALHKPPHRQRPHGIGLPQDRLLHPRRGRPIRRRARPALRKGLRLQVSGYRKIT